jgi:hypothetical protein
MHEKKQKHKLEKLIQITNTGSVVNDNAIDFELKFDFRIHKHTRKIKGSI